MQRTLLMVVQEYLDSTSGFYVNSIHETDEALQVAKIAERVYYRMVQQYPDLLFTMKDTNLDAVSDSARPNYLLIPKDVQDIQQSKIYYNVAEGSTSTLKYKELIYMPPVEFADYTGKRDDSSANAIVVEGFDSNKMVVIDNQWPTYFTSFDNTYVVFDSYHKDYDSTLQASKTRIVATEQAIFLQEDDFIIPIPETLSETYLDMFLDEAMNLIYQQPNAMLSQRARAARIRLQQDNRKLGQSRGKKSYGRAGITYRKPKGHQYD